MHFTIVYDVCVTYEYVYNGDRWRHEAIELKKKKDR